MTSGDSRWLSGLASYGTAYEHHKTSKDNGSAHLKSFLTYHQVSLPITPSLRTSDHKQAPGPLIFSRRLDQ